MRPDVEEYLREQGWVFAGVSQPDHKRQWAQMDGDKVKRVALESELEDLALNIIEHENPNDYDKIKKVLAFQFMHYLDENRPEGKMCLSNGECAYIEKAFNEQNWSRLAKYLDKYVESEDEKVRKALIEGVRQIRCKGDVTQEQMIAYLKKPKELKHAPDDLQKSFEAGQMSVINNPEQYRLCKKTDFNKEDKESLKFIHQAISCAYADKAIDAQTCAALRKWLNGKILV